MRLGCGKKFSGFHTFSLIGRLKKNKMSARSESAVEQHTTNTGGGGSGYHGVGGSLDADRHSMQSKMSGTVYGTKKKKKEEYAGGWEEIRRSCCFAGTVTL